MAPLRIFFGFFYGVFAMVAIAAAFGLASLFLLAAIPARVLARPFRAAAYKDHPLGANPAIAMVGWSMRAVLWLPMRRGTWDASELRRVAGRCALVSNHRSWLDGPALYAHTAPWLPAHRYLIKRQLLWLPLVGTGLWAAGMPALERRTHTAQRDSRRADGEADGKAGGDAARQGAEENAKSSTEGDAAKDDTGKGAANDDTGKGTAVQAGRAKGAASPLQDMGRIRQAYKSLKHTPSTLANFVEGTRLRPTKHAANPQYRNLLPPRTGGLGVILEAFPDLECLYDCTFCQPSTPDRLYTPSLWRFVSLREAPIELRVRRREIPGELRGADFGDPAARARLREWVEGLWREKDEWIETRRQEVLGGAA